ncbi:TonB-dependent receptor [Coraliomargarita sp. SDUM461003]|uniref:TonB-dependent receptor n=1 Tax=Thalassobacterium maritimum TaxID=3041265 RepID=A0ABU1AUY7_9BACT|nr:TonB-dependent receptor [Coraliomargarita sp. SDUM461003]MDQ8207971.1 TonB-dependent receptor [Coraliomargarita sp. SDUM461003]
MKQHISAIALISISSVAFAQENDIQMLPTTVVTGELWESDIQNTTASVTVLDQAALENNGVQHFEDVINAIPNLTWTGGSSRPRYIQIRGIGENSQYEGETPDSSVRFLIDDLDLTGVGTVGNLFDVQQVEVLRGPQAGAFGANAAGGVVRIVSNEPTSYWTGQVEATVGNDNLRSGGIAVGGPIIESNPEQLTFRLSVHQLEQDGFRENKFLNKDDSNGRDELTTRLKVRWLANQDWQFDTNFFYANADNGFDEFSLTNDRTQVYSDEPGRDEQESMGTSLRTRWSGLDEIDIIGVTSFTKTNSTYSYDGDWSNPTDPLYVYTDFLSLDRSRNVFSQEISLNSKAQTNALGMIDRWTIGVYGQSLNEDSNAAWTTSGYLWNTDFNSETLALFGQATHEFNNTTRLTLQLRVEHYSVEVAADGIGPDAMWAPVVPFDYELDSSETLWGGNITLEHDLSQAMQAHIALGRGYKAGGASTPNFTGLTNITYENETLWTVETGLRARLFDNAVDTSVTLFYIYREDPQFRDSEGAGSFFDYVTTNGDTAKHWGLEGDATWYFAENWSLSTTLGLLEAERSTYNAGGVSVSSRDVANAPHFTYSARLDYNSAEALFGSIELVGSDEYYESNSHTEKRNAFAVVNATIGYRYKNWTFTVWAKNLLDEEYEERVFFFDNTYDDNDERYESPANPRVFGVTANYNW